MTDAQAEHAATTEDVRRWKQFGTPTVSDALDKLGIAGQAFGIHPLDRSFRLVGRAFTGMYQPVDTAGGTVGDYIDDVASGDVIVLDNGGCTDATVWGDILTMVAHRRGIAGTVINGVCRDSDRSLALNYPLFSKGTWMRTGKDRVQLVATNVPVVLGGVRVRPRDLMFGDGDGVVVIPAELEDKVFEVATDIDKAEDAIRERVRAGSRLDEARAQLRYFDLQSGR